MSGQDVEYPWLRLLELELEGPAPVERKRPGRPKNAFPRKRVRSALTHDEQASLDGLVALMEKTFGRQLHRGHLIAFMTFRLRSQLQESGELRLPADVDSFQSLARYLDREP